MPDPYQLLKRAQKISRRMSLQSLLDQMRDRKLSDTDRLGLLRRIVNESLAGNITASEANKLTKAVMEGTTS